MHSSSLKTIPCPHHPESALNRINPNLNSSRHAYCPVCLIKMEDGAALYKKFITLSSFISNTSTSFSQYKEMIIASGGPEKAYLDVLAGKAESFSRLSMHLAEQKEEINRVYDELTAATLDILEKRRHKDLKILDQELEKMKGFYESLEETLSFAYPNKEELEKMFPDADVIQKQIEKAHKPKELEETLQAIKQNISETESWMKIGLYHPDKRKRTFESFIQNLKEEEKKKPQPVLKFSMKSAKNEIANNLNKFFDSLFSLQNRLSPQIQIIPFFESTLVNNQDLHILKNWLPDSITFNPKFLYRASNHGSEVSRFHQHCDGKGPTITIINCLFEGAKEPAIIGGFLDKSWNSNGDYIKSTKSFLFSLSSKIKCPIKCPIVGGSDTCAAFGHKSYGPAFAGKEKFELAIGNECVLEENSYQGTAKLVNSKSWNGKGEIKFQVIDYEVFGFDVDS